MNIDEYPLKSGRYLIEASAGTGKTWTITHLFLRLVLQNVPVSKILVTTFSKAAAAELKERIVQVLNEAQSGETDLRRLLLLKLAVSSIDEMTIGTIHGFCQKMLKDFALETGKIFDAEIIADDSEYREHLVQSYCRNTFYDSDIEQEFNYADLQKAASLVTQKIDYVIPGEGKKTFKHEVYDYVKLSVEQEKEKDGVLSFDDLLKALHHALLTNPVLASRIQKRYSAVFIDEFQDTDSIQYEIFDMCFPKGGGNVLYMIGDPKQAIYEFRGADIYTYLKAKETAEQKFTLTQNFRSTPAMIEAVNFIFSGGEFPEGTETDGVFLQKNTPFITVTSGKDIRKFPSMVQDSLRLRHYVGTKGNNDKQITKDVVSEIEWLLSDACSMTVDEETEDHQIVSRPLRASDIAILVPKHDQAAEFLRQLNTKGIAASACKSGKIYFTNEAKIMFLLLHCMIQPDEKMVRGLLLSSLFAFTSSALADPSFDSVPYLEHLRHCGEIWQEQGLPSAFLTFLDTASENKSSPRETILSFHNGERSITNYLHLMELLYKKEQEESFSPEDVLDYLNLAIAGNIDTAGEADAESGDDKPDQLRLDRDSASVQIMTMFAAKGLEFPVVFIPFPVRTASHHTITQNVVNKLNDQGQIIADFDKSDPDIKKFARDEALRVQLRLLYVALTRGSYVTYLYTQQLPDNAHGSSANFVQSAQGIIMMRPDAIPAKGVKYFRTSKDKLPNPLSEWCTHLIIEKKESWKNFSMHEFQLPGKLREETFTENLSSRNLPVVSDQWDVQSFSGYVSLRNHLETIEEESSADFDSMDEAENLSAFSGKDNSFRSFPCGIRVGTMFHQVIDALGKLFSSFSPDGGSRTDTIQIIRNGLSCIGYDPDEYENVLYDGIAGTLQTTLPQINIALYQIRHYTQEFEFFLNAPNSLDLHRIIEILRGKASAKARNLVSPFFERHDRKGILNGQIDLIFEHQSKYYIADWKTNYLGPDDADYSAEKIDKTMAKHLYVLQAYLYSAALLRLMRQRGIPDQNFGGVFYLFPRGMAQGSERGIWFDQPPLECLNALLDLFQKGDEI